MNEKLFQFIWQMKLFDGSGPFLTTDGQQIHILNAGRLNHHAGPDFLEARIRAGHTTWAGNIELHIRSSDWKKHQHHKDPGYANIILHVVYEDDDPVFTATQTSFPTLVLHHQIKPELLSAYEKLMSQMTFIPCAESIRVVKELTIHQQMDRMLVERLEEKTIYIEALLTRYKNNWQEVFYVVLAKSFGAQINQVPFERLAMQTPLLLFSKHKQQALQIEALIFGQSGFLNDYFDEPYPQMLQREYQHLKNKYSLQALEKHLWKFLRLRPANFPTIRLAQFAALLQQSTHLFSALLESKKLSDMRELFTFEVSAFWQNHYTFQEVSPERIKSIGSVFVDTLLINAALPVMYIYGRLQGNESCCDRALEFLKQIRPEKNAIIDRWENLNIACHSAGDSQALLHLRKHYCELKRCLECSIGFEILKSPPPANGN
ncbi:MAG: DUF2851 family protein [Chitinophagaceae bacterium]|nr:DUF2851 family protein [Chitinophagaceae bacterium]